MNKLQVTAKLGDLDVAKIIREFDERIAKPLEGKVSKLSAMELDDKQARQFELMKSNLELFETLMSKVMEFTIYHGVYVASVESFCKEVESKLLKDGKLPKNLMSRQAKMFDDAFTGLKGVNFVHKAEVKMDYVKVLAKKLDLEVAEVVKTENDYIPD